MKEQIREIVKDSITTKSHLLCDEKSLQKIATSAALIKNTLKKGKKILICGNGGSAADSQHFAAELVGRFQKERKAQPAIALTTDTSILTALANDYSFDIVFSRQVEALGNTGDLLIALSTSGKARNVILAARQAKKRGLKTISLTGKNGGELAKITDISVIVASDTTARIQESHILIIHILCEIAEGSFKKT